MSRWWSTTAAAAVLVLLTASGAWGHADWQPDEVRVGTEQELTLFVPPEKEGAENARIDLTVLPGWDAPACDPPPGWTCETSVDGSREVVSFVRRVRLAPENRFELSLRVPDRAGEYVFAVTQTYDDGTGVQWSGPPGDEFEGAVLTVVGPTGASPAEQAPPPPPRGAPPRMTMARAPPQTTRPAAPTAGPGGQASAPVSASAAGTASATAEAPPPAAAPLLPRRPGRFAVEDVQAAQSSVTHERLAVVSAAALLLAAALGLLAVRVRKASRCTG